MQSTIRTTSFVKLACGVPLSKTGKKPGIFAISLQFAIYRFIVRRYHFNSTFAYVVLPFAIQVKFCFTQNIPQSRSTSSPSNFNNSMLHVCCFCCLGKKLFP